MKKWLCLSPALFAAGLSIAQTPEYENRSREIDEQGTMRSIEEVRERLRDGRPLVLNAEANRNNRTPATKANYLGNYLAKTLYYLVCPDLYRFGTEVSLWTLRHKERIY